MFIKGKEQEIIAEKNNKIKIMAYPFVLDSNSSFPIFAFFDVPHGAQLTKGKKAQWAIAIKNLLENLGVIDA